MQHFLDMILNALISWKWKDAVEDAKNFVKFGYPIPDGYLDDLKSGGTVEVSTSKRFKVGLGTAE